MSFTLRVQHSFCAGHRLIDVTSECARPHGHNYRAEVFLTGDDVDTTGMVIDFDEAKTRLRSWIDDNWDHAFLLNSEDSVLGDALRTVPGSKTYEFPTVNPTAETMARELFRVLCALLAVPVSGVRIWETDQQFAEFGNSA